MSGEAPAVWAAPSGLGPIPEELAARAGLLAEAQAEALKMISDAQARTAKHLQAIDRIPETQERPHLAFLDVTG